MVPSGAGLNLDFDILAKFDEAMLETCQSGEVRGIHTGEVRARSVTLDE
jgi:hypothetical protein